MSTLTSTNKVPLSIRIRFLNATFIKELSRASHTPVSQLADEAINLYRKYRLKKQLQEAFMSQTEEDAKEAMSDFNDYLTIVDHDESTRSI